MAGPTEDFAYPTQSCACGIRKEGDFGGGEKKGRASFQREDSAPKHGTPA